MLTIALDLAGRGVRFEWAELDDSAAHWSPENRTLQLDQWLSMVDADRVLREFIDLCDGRGDGHWQSVRPALRLVHSAGATVVTA